MDPRRRLAGAHGKSFPCLSSRPLGWRGHHRCASHLLLERRLTNQMIAWSDPPLRPRSA